MWSNVPWGAGHRRRHAAYASGGSGRGSSFDKRTRLASAANGFCLVCLSVFTLLGALGLLLAHQAKLLPFSASNGGGGLLPVSDAAPQLAGDCDPLQQRQQNRWAVITTINPPTEAVRRVVAMAGGTWRVAVVGDTKTPDGAWEAYASSVSGGRVVYLSIEAQRSMPFELANALPEAHYSRKNIGYLYAISRGATHIYDFDDDNVLKDIVLDAVAASAGCAAPMVVPSSGHRVLRAPAATALQPPRANVYAYFGLPDAWPRGLPVEHLHDLSSPVTDEAPASVVRTVGIIQGLADVDPDVDAVWRVAHTARAPVIDEYFSGTAAPLVVPRGTFAPFNSQNTLLGPAALWAAYLPVTTAFRVCDIWRGYWAQRLMWEEAAGGLTVAFHPPNVEQRRNKHSYADDLVDEVALYADSQRLLELLAAWTGAGPGAGLADAGVRLMEEMAAHGFVHYEEIALARAWFRDLARAGLEPFAGSSSGLPPEPLGLSETKASRPDADRAWYRQHVSKPTAFSRRGGGGGGRAAPGRAPELASAPAAACPLDNVDVLVFTGSRDLLVLQYLWRSIELFLPCYRELVVTTDTEGASLSILAGSVPASLPNVRIIVERYPEAVAALQPFDRVQWGNWWADNYTDAEYLLFLDSDAMLALPVTCESLFDDAGRPKWFYWPHIHRFRAATDDVLRGSGAASSSLGNFMAYFPVVMRREWLAATRAAVVLAAGLGATFDESLLWLISRHPMGVSQFHLMGNLAATARADEVAAIPCPVGGGGPSPRSACLTHGHVGLHVGYPHQTVTEIGNGWQIGGAWNPSAHGKFGQPYLDTVLPILQWGTCFVHYHYGGGDLRPGCTKASLWSVPREVWSYPAVAASTPDKVMQWVAEHLVVDRDHEDREQRPARRRCSDPAPAPSLATTTTIAQSHAAHRG